MVDWEDVLLGGGLALAVYLGYRHREDLKEELDRVLSRVRTLEAKRREEEKEVESAV